MKITSATYWYNLMLGAQQLIQQNISGFPPIELRKKGVRFKSDPIPFCTINPTDDNLGDETFAGDGNLEPITNDPGQVIVMEYGFDITIWTAGNAELEKDMNLVIQWRQQIRQLLYSANAVPNAGSIFDCKEMRLGSLFESVDNLYDKTVIGFTYLSKEPMNG